MKKSSSEPLKQKLDAQAQKTKLINLEKRISWELSKLGEFNYSPELFYDNEYLAELQKRVPFKPLEGYKGSLDFEIDLPCTEEWISEELAGSLRASLPDAETRLVICRDGGDPDFAVSAEVLQKAPELFLSGAQAWLIAVDFSVIWEYCSTLDRLRRFRLLPPKIKH